MTAYQSISATHVVKFPGMQPIPVVIHGSQRNCRTTYFNVERTDGQSWGSGHADTWVPKSCVKPIVDQRTVWVTCPECGRRVYPTAIPADELAPAEEIMVCKCGWTPKPTEVDDGIVEEVF